jgi:hypothetical protein
MANVFLTLLNNLGVEMEQFGDSTGTFELNVARETTIA